MFAVGFGLCVREEDWFTWVDKMPEYAMNALIQLWAKVSLG